MRNGSTRGRLLHWDCVRHLVMQAENSEGKTRLLEEFETPPCCFGSYKAMVRPPASVHCEPYHMHESRALSARWTWQRLLVGLRWEVEYTHIFAHAVPVLVARNHKARLRGMLGHAAGKSLKRRGGRWFGEKVAEERGISVDIGKAGRESTCSGKGEESGPPFFFPRSRQLCV